MKRPLIPLPRRPKSFGEKFGRDVEHFGSRQKPEPPPKTYLPHILIGLTAALGIMLAVCLLAQIPKVKTVRAEGGRLYSADVMLYYADLHAGDKLMAVDSSDVEDQLMFYMPLLSSARVRKHLNGNITVTATEYENLYYTCHNRNYYIMTADDLRVLCVMADDTEAKRVGAVYIGLPETARVRVGECVRFIHLPYAPDDASDGTSGYQVETGTPEEENAYVQTVIDALTESPLASRLVGMELSDRYDLWFVLDGSVRVRLGDLSELENKLDTVRKALEEREASGVDAGDMPLSVDVSDPTRVVFRASYEVVIPDWG